MKDNLHSTCTTSSGGSNITLRQIAGAAHDAGMRVNVRLVGQPGERVDHPQHYNSHPSGIECIQVIEHLPFNVGSAIKYLWRAGLKPGEDSIVDLRKARWYIDREMQRQVLQRATQPGTTPPSSSTPTA